MFVSSKSDRASLTGVNLGNWLVLERWMCGEGSPFDGTRAPDEHGLLEELGSDELERRLKAHRDAYITDSTFTWLAAKGIVLIRLPIPYWVFGNADHSPCIGYVDWALDRAAERGQRVLIDLHTVPGGQNASDSSGICGLCAWHKLTGGTETVLDVIDGLARRYAGHPGLFGIEPVNEPANDAVFAANARRWAGRFPERVAASEAVPRAFLEDFYLQAYECALPALEAGAALVLHDRFDELDSWDGFMPRPRYRNVWIDTHRYLVFSGHLLHGTTTEERLRSHRKLARAWAHQIRRAMRYHDVLVGEWSMANLVGEASDHVYRQIAADQARAWGHAGGSCFWSLRNDANGSHPWSFERAVEHGWL